MVCQSSDRHSLSPSISPCGMRSTSASPTAAGIGQPPQDYARYNRSPWQTAPDYAYSDRNNRAARMVLGAQALGWPSLPYRPSKTSRCRQAEPLRSFRTGNGHDLARCTMPKADIGPDRMQAKHLQRVRLFPVDQANRHRCLHLEGGPSGVGFRHCCCGGQLHLPVSYRAV